ncbi:hypothetical protein [Mycoplasmopsis edwardii]|uniref:Uncharacterized protein n=1 Tax=Mycoplasmopsis edwardii TaxID=53558 RepID=A0ACD4PH80_9BACT|nr:hypothetical protein [Mycoplasmopsis edwardii]WBP84000.1 hypothetical protein Me_995_000633 [Mycoplasmopsis edwardii]
MGSKVFAKCIRCEREYQYLFGEINEFALYDTFLKIFEEKQVNLFKKDNFMQVYFDLLKDQMNDKDELNKLLEFNYEKIMNFFLPDEIELLRSNIFMSHELRVHTVFDTNLEPVNRTMLYIPFLKVKFLDGTEYVRKYSENAKYVEFSEDQHFLTCAFCNETIAAFQREEKIN